MSILIRGSSQKLHLKALIALCVIVAVCTGGFPQVRSDARDLSGLEYQVKAGFIYNFAKFTEWPKNLPYDSNSSLILSVISNNDAVSDAFLALNGKIVGGKNIQVKMCVTVRDLKDCHILFLDSTDRKFIQEVLRTVKDRQVLTVGHGPGFTQEGGIINFFIEDGKLRFEVNRDAEKRAGIKLGSQILRSAEIITEGSPSSLLEEIGSEGKERQ
ncbi:MAG: YfiR family protein [bacterium]